MLIILSSYIALVWLLFSKLKLVKWGWFSGTITVLVGAFILAVFMGHRLDQLLRRLHLTPCTGAVPVRTYHGE